MKLLKYFFFLLAMLSFIQAKTQDTSISPTKSPGLQFLAGFNFGWESPYGAGLELGLNMYDRAELDVGAGFGINGRKLGVGIRLFPLKSNSRVSPLLGIHYFHAGGVKNASITYFDDEAFYLYEAGQAVLLNGGIRIRLEQGFNILAAAGYSFVIDGGEAVYKSGSQSTDLREFAQKLAIGGLSFSVGFQANLSVLLGK